LVATLEDSDSNVRECAKQSLVELFTSPGVTDAARADLKKEMTKKSVRKGTMDSVLNQVLSASAGSPTSAASNELSHSGGKKEYVPPSLALVGKTPSSLSNGSGSTPGPSVMSRARTTSRGNTGPKVPSRPPSRAGVVSPTPTDASGGGGSSATGGTSLADIRNVYVSMSFCVVSSPHFSLVGCFEP
jgi:CLIP-associating protein 1/2